MAWRIKQKKCWNKLSRLATQHSDESNKFTKLCEEHYGVCFSDLKELADSDDIIDTIDYGTGSLSFEDFNDMMKTALAKHA